jgi:probable phosphoglycerate mutase
MFLVRHGSHDRLGRILCGRMSGVTLSERGEAEARAVAERLAHEDLAALYSSPMERTLQTAAAVAQATGLPAQTDDDLTEVDYGGWTGARFEDLAADDRWGGWNAERGPSRAPGGETLAEVQARMRRFLERIRARHPDQRIAVVSHGDPIRSILIDALGAPLAAIDRLEISPASVSVLVAGDWGSKIFSLNEGHR